MRLLTDSNSAFVTVEKIVLGTRQMGAITKAGGTYLGVSLIVHYPVPSSTSRKKIEETLSRTMGKVNVAVVASYRPVLSRLISSHGDYFLECLKNPKPDESSHKIIAFGMDGVQKNPWTVSPKTGFKITRIENIKFVQVGNSTMISMPHYCEIPIPSDVGDCSLFATVLTKAPALPTNATPTKASVTNISAEAIAQDIQRFKSRSVPSKKKGTFKRASKTSSPFSLSGTSTAPRPKITPPWWHDAARCTMGQLAHEVVFEDTLPNRQCRLFYVDADKDGVPEGIWAGSVHQDLYGRWRMGKYRIDSAPPLGSMLIPNMKISDQRSLTTRRIPTISFNRFAGLNNKARTRLENMQQIRERTKTYISDIHYSISKDNQLRFYFAFNYLDFIRRNALFAPLYTSTTELLSSCQFVSIKVVRRRVNRANLSNRLTGGAPVKRLFDKKIHNVRTKPVRVDLIRGNKGVLHFLADDPAMNDVTFGLYEYGVEVAMVDTSGDKLLTLLNDRHLGYEILLSKVRSIYAKSLQKGNYNRATNTYTFEYLDYLASLPDSQKYWKLLAERYLTGLSFILGPAVANKGVMRKIMDATDPRIAGPEGIELLVNLVDQLSHNIKSLLGVTKKKAPFSSQDPGTSDASLGSAKRIVRAQMFFKKAFDADGLLNYGVDLLSIGGFETSSARSTLLRLISYDHMDLLLTNEENKFQNTTPAASVATSVFLTPNFLKLPKVKAVDLSDKSDNGKRRTKLAAYSLLRANGRKNSPAEFFSTTTPLLSTNQSNLNGDQLSTINNQIDLMALNGCVTTTISVTETPTNIFDLPVFIDDCSTGVGSFANAGTYIPVDTFNNVANPTANITMPTEGAASSDKRLKKQLLGNNNLVMDYLIQSDFMTGFKTNTGSKPEKSLNGGKYFKSSNTSLPQYQATLVNSFKAATGTTLVQASAASTAAAPAVTSTAASGYAVGATTAAAAAGATTAIAGTAGAAAGVATTAVAGTTGKSPAIPEKTVPGGVTTATAIENFFVPKNNTLASATQVSPQEYSFIGDAIKFEAGEVGAPSLPEVGLKYGFINQIEYLSNYALTEMGVLINEPVWAPLTRSLLNRSRTTSRLLLCRIRKHNTEIADFDGLECPVYDEVFLLGRTSLRRLNLPNYRPSIGTIRTPRGNDMAERLANNYAVSQFAGSYRKDTYIKFKGGSNTGDVGDTTSYLKLKGQTSFNAGHKHEYDIDSTGNGIAKEACSPTHPNICHSHIVKSGRVMPAGSQDIDGVNGVPLHTHKIRSQRRGLTEAGTQQPSKGSATKQKALGRFKGKVAGKGKSKKSPGAKSKKGSQGSTNY